MFSFSIYIFFFLYDIFLLFYGGNRVKNQVFRAVADFRAACGCGLIGENARISAGLRVLTKNKCRAPIARRDRWDWIAPRSPRIPFDKIRIFGIAFVVIARAMIAPLALIAPRCACIRAASPAGIVFFARADAPEGVDGSLDIHTPNFEIFAILEP